MLRPVSKEDNIRLLHWSAISPDSSGDGYCFVRATQHKFTRGDKPFIVLYLQDTDGAVIPGYIFNVENFKAAGNDLTEVERSVVQISYSENYHPRFGMSVILNKVEKVMKPPLELLSAFVDTVETAKQCYEELASVLTQKLKVKISPPYRICTMSVMDCFNGSIGGPALHYHKMMQLLETYESYFQSDEQRMLWGTFLIYVYAHHNVMIAEQAGTNDIKLQFELVSSINNYLSVLGLGTSAGEALYLFSGYKPKDIFTRIVSDVSEQVTKITKEVNLYRSLPITREGDAGYGIVRNYGVEPPKNKETKK